MPPPRRSGSARRWRSSSMPSSREWRCLASGAWADRARDTCGGGARGDRRAERRSQGMNERFWHEIEGRPWAEVQAIQEAALRRQLAYLEGTSAFYRDKLRAAGVRFDAVKTAADLARVPLTLKTE